jgi:hypothetical protein
MIAWVPHRVTIPASEAHRQVLALGSGQGHRRCNKRRCEGVDAKRGQISVHRDLPRDDVVNTAGFGPSARPFFGAIFVESII